MVSMITFWKAVQFHPVILEQVLCFVMEQQHGLGISFILQLNSWWEILLVPWQDGPVINQCQNLRVILHLKVYFYTS